MLDHPKYDVRFVALYIRKSRAESIDDLEKHRMILIDLCHKNNFKYIEYTEVGTSDSIDMRPQMSKLLKEVEEGIYDAVCVVDYDRLSRGDMGDQDKVVKAFKKSDTLIITPDKFYDLNDDMDDEMVEFKGFFARREYKMITKRLRQGKKMGARQGQWTNGVPPFPYVYQTYKNKFNKKGLVVDDDKLSVYREMIEMALRGISPRKIAESFNSRGILTSRGNYWSNTAVQRLLIDETHLGKIISNKTQGDGHKNKRPNAKEHKILPRNQWVIIENCHEAVKTQEEHEKILSLINTRKSIPFATRKQKHALSGLLKCAVCGHNLTFNVEKEKVLVKACWYRDAFGKKCPNRGIAVEILEDLLLDEIGKYKDSFLKVNFDYVERDLEIRALMFEKTKTLEKYQRALGKVNDSYELGDYNRDEWIKRKNRWQNSIKTVKTELYDLEAQRNALKSMTNEERSKNVDVFFESIRTVADNTQRNNLYRTIIDSIIYSHHGDNDIEIKINFK